MQCNGMQCNGMEWKMECNATQRSGMEWKGKEERFCGVRCGASSLGKGASPPRPGATRARTVPKAS